MMRRILCRRVDAAVFPGSFLFFLLVGWFLDLGFLNMSRMGKDI